MTDARLRTAVGLFWVASQLVVFLVIGVARMMGGFEPEDVKGLVEITLPMFSGLGTVVIRYFARHRHDTAAGELLNLPYVVLTWGLPLLFSMLVIGAIILRALNLAFDDIEELKFTLATLQTIYVGYIAILLAPLFETSEAEIVRKPEA